jgi:hypothetical protein
MKRIQEETQNKFCYQPQGWSIRCPMEEMGGKYQTEQTTSPNTWQNDHHHQPSTHHKRIREIMWTSLRTTCNPAVILTRYHLYTNPEHYCYTNLFGFSPAVLKYMLHQEVQEALMMLTIFMVLRICSVNSTLARCYLGTGSMWFPYFKHGATSCEFWAVIF